MMDEQQFQLRADEALQKLYKALGKASDQHDFEADFGGTLTVEFEEPPAKFVVSPNAPVRQIWVSAMSRSFKLAWAPELGAFALDGETLPVLLERLTRQFLNRLEDR